MRGTVRAACVAMALLATILTGGCSSAHGQEAQLGAAEAGQDAQASAAETGAGESPEGSGADLGDLVVHFVDVGQGDAELIELPDGKVMLIDAGEASSAPAVLAALEEADVDSIDYLVASHPHADHIGGMEAVLAAYDVEEVWAPDAPADTETYEGFLDAVADEGLFIDEAVAGRSIVEGDAGYAVDLLGPEGDVDSDDMNDYSAIVRVTYGETSFLFAGDADADKVAASGAGHVDVLKASHHGSETGTDAAVMAATTPDCVVLSYAEGNSYGHPDQCVLDAIAASGAAAYSTAANGDVIVTSDGEGVSVSTEREGEIVAGVSAEERARAEAAAQTEAEARARAEAEAAAQAEAQRQQQLQQQQQTQSKTVVVTPTGEKYHVPGCRTLSRSKTLYEMTEDEAIAQGYDACKVCRP